ncbi:putative ankyrin repeat protein RBE_0220 [Physella acuta]|uniref:putative ankyrin repeat protein RBE_0220 n=1 Tax=Physella acuta TaxID=109671 RepID=UPI0027DD6E54|nr:putative ankyrin repeat protein RBE_0220 [Physella acuta]
METILQASAIGDIETIKRMLQDVEDINLVGLVDANGNNALILATLKGHEEITELLIQNGAYVDHANVEGMDALMFASQNGYEKTFKLLLPRLQNPSKLYLMDVVFLAFENGHTRILEILSNFVEERYKRFQILIACSRTLQL